MKLTIVNVDIADFGTYKCVAKNSLGETDGSIKLYRKYSVRKRFTFSIFHVMTFFLFWEKNRAILKKKISPLKMFQL